MTSEKDPAEALPERQWSDSRTDPVSIVPIPGAVSGLSPCLIVLTNPQLGQVTAVGPRPIVIGRGSECDFPIRESSISRLHLRIARAEDGALDLEDLGSTNGTFVNGERVTRCQLRSGDRIQLGRCTVLKVDFMGELEGDFHNQLYEAGTRDSLTGLHNRRYFDQHLEPEFLLAQRHSETLTLILLDLDHFKRINDAHGHIAGDMVLRSFAKLLVKRCRREDILARYGGEEFVLLLRRTDRNGAQALAEALRQKAEATALTYQDSTIEITVSAGAATVGDGVRFATGQDLLQAADDALYRAKERGRNRVVCHGD